MNLNDLAQTVHAANVKWWQDIETGLPIKRNKSSQTNALQCPTGADAAYKKIKGIFS